MKVCLICSGLVKENIRQQPWCYMYQVCRNLGQLGIEAKLVSDGYPRLPQFDDVDGIPVHRLRHVRFWPVLGNPALQSFIEAEDPDVILWNVGLTSFYHLRPGSKIKKPIVGVFTSPVYHLSDLFRMGTLDMLKDFGFVYIHLIGAMVPSVVIRGFLGSAGFESMITLSNSTKEGLTRRGMSARNIDVVSPGIDDDWVDAQVSDELLENARARLELSREEFAVLYFGSPIRIRGTDTLVKAASLALPYLPNLRLRFLSRGSEGEFVREEARLRSLASRLGLEDKVKVIPGCFSKQELISFVAAADAIALPFKLVQSDVPIGILEAQALRKPVISTTVNSLPELLAGGRGYMVKPGDARELAQALTKAASDSTTAKPAMAGPYTAAERRWIEVSEEMAQILRRVCSK